MASMLASIEDIMSKFVETPVDKTKAALDRLIKANKKHPGPLLAKAFVTGFGRYDFTESRTLLEAASALMKKRDVIIEDSGEGDFTRALYETMNIEASLRTRQLAGKATTRSVIDLEKKSLKAQNAMDKAVKRIGKAKGQDLAKLLYAILRIMSSSNATAGSSYKSSLRALSKMRSSKSVGHLAGFFQIYAYRRKRDYPSAIRAGKKLERQVPGSALVKRTVASCYYYNGRLSKADQYFKQAVSLAPNDLTVKLDRARTLARMGKTDSAKKLIDRAAEMGSKKSFPQSHRSAMHMLNIANIGEYRF